MEAFLISTGIVALAEMGDKTQLLALLLAARFKRPWPIIAGIFFATVLNHAVAGAVGSWIQQQLGLSFPFTPTTRQDAISRMKLRSL